TGAGVAVDAAARGYEVLLLERGDFGVGTSSRSTKLAHGGVRYLRQGHVGLVLEALRERGRLLRNAPHLVHDLAFVLPCYRRREVAFYGVGMKAYDLLAAWGGVGRAEGRPAGGGAAAAGGPVRRAARRGGVPRRPVRRRPAAGRPDPHRRGPRGDRAQPRAGDRADARPRRRGGRRRVPRHGDRGRVRGRGEGRGER